MYEYLSSLRDEVFLQCYAILQLMNTIVGLKSFRWSIRPIWKLCCAFSIEKSIAETSVFTSISFYKFTNIPDERIEAIVDATKRELKEQNVKGTLLLSTEGYNGQFAIPCGTLQNFRSRLFEADKQIFSEFHLTHGETIDYSSGDVVFPFKKLVIRRKKEALTDKIVNKAGLDIDWNMAGNELPPQLWQAALESNNPTVQLESNETSKRDLKEKIAPAMIIGGKIFF